MIRFFDVYGSKDHIETCRNELEVILGINFFPRDSSYIGGYYHSEEGFSLEPNLTPEAYADLREDEHKECKTILYANEVESPDVVRDLLLQRSGWKHIRRSE